MNNLLEYCLRYFSIGRAGELHKLLLPAADFFKGSRQENTAKVLFIPNGVLNLSGTLCPALVPGWVLTIPGLMAFGDWNLLHSGMAILVMLVLRVRASALV